MKTMQTLKWVFLCIPIACSSLPQGGNTGPLGFVVVSQRLGELEPCGCQFKPKGGLERTWNLLQKWKTQTQALIPLSAGATFVSGPQSDNPSTQETALFKMQLTLEAYREMGFYAVALAPEDLRVGENSLREASRTYGVPLITTNLMNAAGTSVFDPTLRLQKGGVSILVLGIADLPEPGVAPDGYWVQDPKDAIAKALKDAAPTDFVVVLGSIPIAKAKLLAAEFPQVRLFLGGKAGEHSVQVEQITGQTLFVNPLSYGKALARVDIPTDVQQGSGFFNEAHADAYRTARETWLEEEKVADDKLRGKLSPRTRREILANRLDLARRLSESESIPLSDREGLTHFGGEVVDLDAQWDGSANPMTSFVQRYKATVRDIALSH